MDDGGTSPGPGVDKSAIENFTITVNAVNDPPVAVNDSATTAEDTAVTIDVLANDTSLIDGNWVPGSVTVQSGPSQGSTSVNSATGAVTYTPAADKNGADGFDYQVCDDGVPGSACATATVSITITPVQDAPRPVDDFATVAEGGTVTVLDSTATSVLANDLEVDGESLTATENLGGATQHGSASVSATGTFSYTHDGSETTFDTFAYEVCDGTGVLPGEGCATASVFITVTPVNDAPVALPQALLTEGATPLVITLTGTDAENDSLTFTLVTPNPTNGALTFLTQAPPSNATVIYTPSQAGDLPDSFGFRVTDPGGLFDETVVDLNVPDPAIPPGFPDFVVAKDIPGDDLEAVPPEIGALEIESSDVVVITLIAFADVLVDPLLVGDFAFTLVGPAPACMSLSSG